MSFRRRTTPGRRLAVEKGCTCPVGCNRGGIGFFNARTICKHEVVLRNRTDTRIFLVASECPMHGDGDDDLVDA